MIRLKYLYRYRSFYKLTTPISPNDPKRTNLDVIFPALDQKTEDVMAAAMLDPFSAHWFNMYFHGMLKRNNDTKKIADEKFASLKYDSYEDYIKIREFFVASQVVGIPNTF